MNTNLRAALLLLPLTLAAATVAQTNPLAKAACTVVSFSHAESDLGFQVHVRGTLLQPKADHRYTVLYQLRVHTQKGEAGPILGDAKNKDKCAITLGEIDGSKQAQTDGFDFTFDLLRRDLTAMAPLTPGRMVLRVEPQIYDQTDQRFVTAPKSDALIAVATVGDNGTVHSLVPFAKWFASCYGPSASPIALDTLASLDAVDLEGSAIIPAFEAVLTNTEVKPAQLTAFIAALPAKELATGKNNLRGICEALAKHTDESVRDAVATKQKQADLEAH